MAKLNIKQNHNLEVSIVGCLLKDGSFIRDESVSKLKVSDFMYADVRTVFQSIKELELA